jgi:hypothetical protein
MKQNHCITDEVYIEAYKRLKVLGQIAVELGVPDITVWRRCKKLGLEFKNGGHNKGAAIKFNTMDILEGKHPQYSTLKLKNRLIKEGLLSYKCDDCGISEWNNKKIALHLDHIDGNCKNHRLNNLRLLCPNCHSQTDTWCGKNK